MDNIKHIIESLLFVAEEPLTIERIRNIIAVVTPDEVRSALAALSDEYTSRGGGFHLREVAGGYQLRTRPEFTQWIKRLLQPKQQRLSKPALETLAIIAYKQPIMRSDVEYIRGVDCGGILRMLLERKLIRILGRKELPGRPMIYGTTRQFLEVFDLKDLTDLPTPKEIEELGKGPAEQAIQPTKTGND
ncbi:MAG: SMC-Scp complex subunit ScpB [Desulfobacterales bacterium]|jgi:segregation and condensation protein B